MQGLVGRLHLKTQKAKELCFELGRLQAWFRSTRTCYGKFSKTNSGLAPKKLNGLQQWILDHFNLL